MILPFLYLLNAVLLTRLPLLLRDGRVRRQPAVVACVVQLGALIAFAPDWPVALAGVVIVSLSLLGWRVERKEQGSLPTRRLLMLVLYFLLFAILCSPSLNLRFREKLGELATAGGAYFFPGIFLGTMHWRPFLAYLLGILLSLNEANLLVRCVIEKFIYRPVEPGKTTGSPLALGKTEYDRGRLIGLLERLLIFFFVMQNQFATLGFVVAAKGIARFKELENRDFAEYFLIGTMLSIVTAGAIALLVKNVLLP